MNPCKECMKAYKETPCSNLGHCAFEGTNVNPITEKTLEASFIEQRQIA